MKRASVLLLSLCLLFYLTPLALAAKPEPEPDTAIIEISTAAEFIQFSTECSRDVYSLGQTFCLTADLDLSAADFDGVPYFAGTFLGGGHHILGVKMTHDGSRQGLFRRVAEGAVIQDLFVTGLVSPGGTQQYVGGLCGINAGKLSNCSFSGTVSGLDAVGGIAGRNEKSGIIEKCRYTGTLSGEHQVGGITGENAGIVSACVNMGKINSEAITPQREARFDLAVLSEEDSLDLTDIGGIAGNNEGVISDCRNTGVVGYKNSGYNVGGIAGKSSGYLNACENTAVIYGRRDTGGIAGQLIPYLQWEFSNDKLDALSGQLGSLNYLIHKASQNASDNTGALKDELSRLNGYTSGAISELESILRNYERNDARIIDSIHVDPDTGEISIDQIDLSGINTSGLTSVLTDLNAEANVLSGILHSSFNDLTEDTAKIIRQMSGVIDGMYSLLSTSSKGELYETVDLSADESYDHDFGAVDSCTNYGDIFAESNAGGIVGTVGFEISFDMEDSLDASRFITSDASQYIFAVVRACKSHSEIQVKNDHAGCIVAQLSTGAIVDCVGTGSAASQSGDYVAGIAGESQGTVRGCWTRSVLSGGKYIGGVTGLGKSIIGCRSWTHIERALEYSGAVAGWAEGTILDNLYVDSSPAGIDGVSFSGMTDPLSPEDLLKEPGLPDNYESLTVTFVAEGTVIDTVKVPFGGSIDSLPEVENSGDRYWKWDDFNRNRIYYDMTVEGKYYAPGTTLSSSEEVPVFLVEGVFYEGQSLTVADYPVDDEETPLAAYTLYVDGYDSKLTVHMLSEEDGRLFLIGKDGEQHAASYNRDGKYIVFQLDNGQSFLLLQASPSSQFSLWIAVTGAAVLVIALVLLISRKKKKRSAVTSE